MGQQCNGRCQPFFMHGTLGAFLFFIALPLLAQTFQPASSQVTLPLGDYETLRRGSDSPSATVVDTILLSGGFRERSLAITFSGRTTGSRPLVRTMEQTNDVTISGCKGDGIVSRGGKGAFELVPLAPSFEVRCDLRISGSDRLRMHVTPNVLSVRATVADAELVIGDEDDAGARDYTLVRHVSGPGETLAATATGRYLITLLPDATRFRYAIDVHNPNRTTSSVDLALQSDEHLQQIDSAAPYEVTPDGHYLFSIPPGDSTITLTGELKGASFIAPVKASLQYLVLESHPLLRPTVQTPSKRISLGETGVTPTYRGAVAFETGTERIAWTVTRLQALHAISYAVNDATHRVFIPVDGPVLGETTFAVHNEGAPELVLPAKPEPTFVSLAGEAMLMTKNAAGQVTVPLSQGDQEVLVQHRQALRRGFGFAIGRVSVPRLSVPATNTDLTLVYPAQWVPLFESFAAHANIWSPDLAQVLLFLGIALWIERLLAWLGMPMTRRFVIACTLSLAASIVLTLLVVVVLGASALTIAWIASLPPRPRVVTGTLFATGALLCLLVTGMSRVGNSRAYTSSAPATKVSDEVLRSNASESSAPNIAAVAFAYQGLPAKFALPNGERQSSFAQELLRVDRPQSALVIAISIGLVTWLGVLLAVFPLLMLWRERHELVATVRAKLPKREEVMATA